MLQGNCLNVPDGTKYTITFTFVNDAGATEDVPYGPFTK